ncbi:chaperone DnaJ domain-containing protein [Meiothermus phage MMP17]|nr:molecular chaperone [Meiothermus phage MMP7]QAY18085.1 chaperone DnaJ domain-containing protein [Meiothermus phage MMP17]
MCQECQGCGYVEYVAGFYFSDSFGNYLPREEIARCEVCDGTGFVEVWDEDEAVLEGDG